MPRTNQPIDNDYQTYDEAAELLLYCPTPEDIQRAAFEIQCGWSDIETARRARGLIPDPGAKFKKGYVIYDHEWGRFVTGRKIENAMQHGRTGWHCLGGGGFRKAARKRAEG